MLVIPNCMVKPTAASAITEALTSPNPNAAIRMLMAESPASPMPKLRARGQPSKSR